MLSNDAEQFRTFRTRIYGMLPVEFNTGLKLFYDAHYLNHFMEQDESILNNANIPLSCMKHHPLVILLEKLPGSILLKYWFLQQVLMQVDVARLLFPHIRGNEFNRIADILQKYIDRGDPD